MGHGRDPARTAVLISQHFPPRPPRQEPCCSNTTLVTSTPHDALFKTVFQHPENAASELAHLLAPELVSAIDWSTLAVEPGTYVDRKLAEKRSDLLFSANLTTSSDRVLVYLLFEHRSSPEPKMALRLLGYMVRIWERFSCKHADEPLPLIIPAVLAHAPGGWTSPTQFSSLFSPNLGSLADAVLPDFSYSVDDLHRTTDADLRRRALALQARLALWLMRDARDAARLLRRLLLWLPDIERLAQLPNGRQALEPLLRYIVLISPDLQLEQIRAILEDRAPAAEGITMTIAEQLRAEGEVRGEARGEAKGKAEAIILFLRSRGLDVDEQVQARLVSMSIEDLDACLRRAATVASVDELLEG